MFYNFWLYTTVCCVVSVLICCIVNSFSGRCIWCCFYFNWCGTNLSVDLNMEVWWRRACNCFFICDCYFRCAEACNCTISNNSPQVFFTIFKLLKYNQIVQRIRFIWALNFLYINDFLIVLREHNFETVQSEREKTKKQNFGKFLSSSNFSNFWTLRNRF